jgi:YggT family protein
MTDVKNFLIDLIFFFPLILLFLRIFCQLSRVPFTHPIYQWTLQSLRPVLGPLENVIPRFRNLSIAALVLMWLLCTLKAWLSLDANGVSLGAWLVIGLGDLGLWIGGAFMIMLLIYVIMSFARPEPNPYTDLVARLLYPLLAPVRRWLPSFGPIDLSPMILVLGYVILRSLVCIPVIKLMLGVPLDMAFQ